MTWINKAAVAAVAFATFALCSTTASAQTAPTLTVTVSGTSVTISWTSVPGATGYTLQAGSSPGAADIASVNLPSSNTFVSVTAPPGNYYLRVRAFAGSLNGPFSNEGVAAVGITPPCNAPPAAPALTATPQGGSVRVSWDNVGASSYRVEFSRTPTTTELAQNVSGSTTSHTAYVGMLGIFYVRVTATNACGQTTSATISFSITSLSSGPGPRTADPPPGQLLPMPGYALDVVRNAAQAYAADLAAHSGPACKANNTWLFKLLRDLRQRDSRWGLNWKRGWPGTMSSDIITYNPTAGPDDGATHIYLADVLGGECETNAPKFEWDVETSETWKANSIYPGLCNNADCARWTIDPYLAAGFPR